jgi:SUKH superfamily protein
VDVALDPDEWELIESTIGTVLPADYKQFIDTYGSGAIGRFVSIFNPFSKNQHVNLLDAIRTKLDALRELQGEFESERRYPLFPEAGGLLPFGGTDNGDVFFWKTSGEPDQWPVVINESRAPEYEEFAIDMTGFLAGILMRTITSAILPRAFPSQTPRFSPRPT